MEKLVSVIMANYNGERYLRTSINSVLKQRYQFFELIIVDDNSSDDSIKIIENFTDSRIKLIKNNENIGPHKSRNIAISHAKGEYISVLDSDDLYFYNKLYNQIKYLEKHKDIDIVFSKAVFFGSKIGLINTPTNDQRLKFSLFRGCQICHSTALWKSNNNIRYNENYPKAQDYELWSRCFDKYNMACVPSVLVGYRVHDNQLSSYSYEREKIKLGIIESLLRRVINNIGEEELHYYLESLKSESQVIDIKYLDNASISIINKYHFSSKDNEINNVFAQTLMSYCLNQLKNKNYVNFYATNISKLGKPKLKQAVYYLYLKIVNS